MTDQDEFAARSQLKRTREGNAWILLYRRRRMDNVMAQAIREIAWNAANDPSKCPVKRGSQRATSSPVRFSEAAE